MDHRRHIAMGEKLNNLKCAYMHAYKRLRLRVRIYIYIYMYMCGCMYVHIQKKPCLLERIKILKDTHNKKIETRIRIHTNMHPYKQI